MLSPARCIVFSGIDNSISNIDDSVLTSINDLSILSQKEVQASISVFDSAIFMIGSLQSGVAAVQSRLGSTISNLQNISDNATIARKYPRCRLCCRDC